VFARNIEADTTGNLYISDGARVRKVTADGIIRTIAGTGARGFSGDGGPATSAQLGLIGGIAVDGSGNLFISEFSNNRIRRVTRDGIISTVAGDGARGYTEDGGRAIAGQVGQPRGMTADALGNIFVVVQGVPGTDVATVFAIRKVSREGVLSTVFRQF
jgi:sugar lactone lactonase YvrE